jgi:hypothetical protein
VAGKNPARNPEHRSNLQEHAEAAESIYSQRPLRAPVNAAMVFVKTQSAVAAHENRDASVLFGRA